LIISFDLLEDILAFLYTTGDETNPEDDMLNQVSDEEMDEDFNNDDGQDN